MLCETSFDLAQFDAEAPDLDLEVVASEELDVAVGQPAAQVPGAVHAGSRLLAEGIGEELLRGQLRPVQIATRDTGSADVQLPRHPHRHRRAMPIQYVDLRVRDRTTDRYDIRCRRAGTSP